MTEKVRWYTTKIKQWWHGGEFTDKSARYAIAPYHRTYCLPKYYNYQ
ncbi:hypothetical protein [Scytonema sp. NUACC21]